MADRLQVNPLAHAMAGGIGGALSTVVTYPLLTLSTLAQTKSKKTIKSTKDGKNGENGENTKDVANGKDGEGHDEERNSVSTLSIAKYILKKEGISGFYPGLESCVVGVAMSNLVYYYFYELVTKVILKGRKSSRKSLSTLESISVGAIAGLITAVSTNPLWVANTRMTVTGNKKQSTISVLLEIIKKDGVKALFSGVLPALILVLNPIIQYTIFEQVKNIINRKRANALTSTHAFFIGAFGKLVATGSTYPYITLKSRMHLKDQSGKSPKTVLDWINEIYAKDGVQGFYYGLSVKLSQSVFAAAFLFYFKEELTKLSAGLLKLLKTSKKVGTLSK